MTKRPPKAERRRLRRLYKEVSVKREAERARALSRCNQRKPGTSEHTIAELGRRAMVTILSRRPDPVVIDDVLDDMLVRLPVEHNVGRDPYPVGPRMFWCCTGCGSHIFTEPVCTVECVCGNLRVEISPDDCVYVNVRDIGQLGLVELHGRSPMHLVPRTREEAERVVRELPGLPVTPGR